MSAILDDTAEVIFCTPDNIVKCTNLRGGQPCGTVSVVSELKQKKDIKLPNPAEQNTCWQTVYFCCWSCDETKVFDWGDGTDLMLAGSTEIVSAK